MASDLATLKQKIIATDKLIREYQNSKFECDVLKKKNEELTRLTDKLHNDLSARNRECARLLAEAEPLKKVNAEMKLKIEEAQKKAFKWESELEANKVYTDQLVEKVKSLEKLEKEEELHAATNKELSKMKIKLETLKDQATEAKESLAKARKELKHLQTKHKQLLKYALAFGKAAVNNGKLTVMHKRFYQRLCESNDAISEEECEVAINEFAIVEEDDIQSKMLENLLTDDGPQTTAHAPNTVATELVVEQEMQPEHVVPIPKQVELEIASPPVNRMVDGEFSQSTSSVKDTSEIVVAELPTEQDSSSEPEIAESIPKQALSKVISPVTEVVEGESSQPTPSEKETSKTNTEEIPTEREKQPDCVESMPEQAKLKVFPANQIKETESNQPTPSGKICTKLVAEEILLDSISIDRDEGKLDEVAGTTNGAPEACSISLFEIDRSPPTPTNPSSFTESTTSNAVQVAEIHSSPSKLKSKKNITLSTSNDTLQSKQPAEPLRASPISAFVPIIKQPPAFKVPAVPPLPGNKDPISSLKRHHPSSNEGQDREVNRILHEARKLFTDVPRILSPLPEPPKPKPEPKHAMIPRCAFNWMGKKLPISTELTEQFGAYVKPGARIRVRFRRVSRRLRELRAPDIICNPYKDVTNYAEAERRSRRLIDPNAPLIDEAESAAAPGQTSNSSVASVQLALTQQIDLEEGAFRPTLAVAQSQEKSRDHSTKKQQAFTTTLISSRETPILNNGQPMEPTTPTLRPPIRAKETSAMSYSTPNPNVEKRPKLTHFTEEPATRLSPQLQKEQASSTSKFVFEKRPNLMLATPQENVTGNRLHAHPELTQKSVEENPFAPRSVVERAKLVETPGEPLERLLRTEQNLTPKTPSTPAQIIHQRSKGALFGSDSESGSEAEEAVPAQHRSLPKLITRPSFPQLVTKAKRPEHQPIRTPMAFGSQLINASHHSDPINSTPVRPASIAPCSESLVAAVSKVRSTPRLVAARRQTKDATTPVPSPIDTHHLDESYVPLADVSSKRRIAHAPKRPLEDINLEAPAKKAKKADEAVCSVLRAQPAPPAEVTRAQSATSSKNYSAIRVRKDLNQAEPVRKHTQQARCLNTILSPTSDKSSSSLVHIATDENAIGEETQLVPPLDNSENPKVPSADLESPESLPADLESPESPPAEIESPESPPGEIESSESPPGEIESPQSPLAELESPESPPTIPDTSQPPLRSDRNPTIVSESSLRVIPQCNPEIKSIPTEASRAQPVAEPMNRTTYPPSDQAAQITSTIDLRDLPAHLAVLTKDMSDETPKISNSLKKIRTTVRQAADKVCQAEELTDEVFNKAVDRLSLGLVAKHPFVIIRHFVLTIIRACDADVDLTHTPPLPPLSIIHQRIIALLLTLDEKNRDLDLEPHRYSDYFLSEASYSMFNPDSVLTADEMCSLTRAYVALCRAIGNLGRARSFLYDCLFMHPPRAYALAYTAVTVWGEILRPVTFPIGPSCVDQTIAFLLLFCLKVKVAPGTTGRVTSIRTLLQTTYGYKGSTVTTASALLDSLMNRLKETHNSDEASSLAWCLALIARWEGVAWANTTIEKVLWPFLQRWSAGEGTNAGAVAAIRTIGLLGKWIPAAQRKGVDMVSGAMKTLINSPDVATSIAEAAVETVVLLGSEMQPQSVLDILKEWKPKNDASYHLQNVLKAFLKKNMSKNSLVNCASDENENNSASE